MARRDYRLWVYVYVIRLSGGYKKHETSCGLRMTGWQNHTLHLLAARKLLPMLYWVSRAFLLMVLRALPGTGTVPGSYLGYQKSECILLLTRRCCCRWPQCEGEWRCRRRFVTTLQQTVERRKSASIFHRRFGGWELPIRSWFFVPFLRNDFCFDGKREKYQRNTEVAREIRKEKLKSTTIILDTIPISSNNQVTSHHGSNNRIVESKPSQVERRCLLFHGLPAHHFIGEGRLSFRLQWWRASPHLSILLRRRRPSSQLCQSPFPQCILCGRCLLVGSLSSRVELVTRRADGSDG